MVPALRGSGIVAGRVPKKVLQFAGIDDVFTSSSGSTKTVGNFVKATFDYLLKTYGFLTPHFWRGRRHASRTKSPFQEYTDLLAKPTTKAIKLEEDKLEQMGMFLAEQLFPQVPFQDKFRWLRKDVWGLFDNVPVPGTVFW